MKNVFKSMSLRLKIVSLLCLGIIIVGSSLTAYSAVNYVMVHMNPRVPSSPGLTLYQSDGSTPVNSGDEITSLLSWTGTQFTVQLVIKNTGNTVLTTGLDTSQVPAGWSVVITGNGTLTQGGTQPVTLVVHPNSTAGGTSAGDFDLWFTG